MNEQIEKLVELIIAGGDERDKQELLEISRRIEARIIREGIRW